MKRSGRFPIAALSGLAAFSAPFALQVVAMADEASQMAPARDAHIAVLEEFELARQAGTAAAYDLFAARHPKHPLAETARRERDRLLASGGSLDHPAPPGGKNPYDR